MSPDACTPETDQAFCARIAKTCESQSGTDNCGMARTADCGTCSSAQGCVVGVCMTPVCSTYNYASSTITAFSRSGSEDDIGTVTPDGQVVVYLQSSSCGGFSVIIADESAPGSGTYTPQDITTKLSGLGMATDNESYTITKDGLTLIGRTSDHKKLESTKRSALGMTDFGSVSTADFDAVNGQVGLGAIRAPQLSADGLELFYTINNVSMTFDGNYDSVRASTSVPFPAGTRMPAPANDYEYVAGISSDRLTIFIFDSFSSRILTRTSTTAAFVNPSAPGAPPQVGGWDHKPLADCTHLVGTGATAGGCQNEDVLSFTRQ